MPIIWKEELLFSGVSRMRKWVLRSIVKLVQSPFCRQASFVLLCSITRWEPLLFYMWCDDCDYLKRLNMKWECFISAISTALMSILSLFEVKLQIFIILLCLGCLTFFFICVHTTTCVLQEFGFTNQVFWVHHLMALSKEIFIKLTLSTFSRTTNQQLYRLS